MMVDLRSRNGLLIWVVFIFLLISFTACAMSAKQQYSFARKEYAQTLKKYNDYYDLQNDDTKAMWKEQIDPKFKLLDTALDQYKKVLYSGEDPAKAEAAYLEAKAVVLKLLLDAGVLKAE